MNEHLITIFLNGDIQNNNYVNWYKDTTALFQQLGYPFTHIGVISKSFHSGKVLTVARKEKELLSKLNEGEIPESISCYSLPKGYKSASFDYEILCERTQSYIAFILREKDFTKESESIILATMKKYITVNYGEVFSTLADEMPLLYVSTGDTNNLKSYQLIKNY